jgi:hypothetical protein
MTADISALQAELDAANAETKAMREKLHTAVRKGRTIENERNQLRQRLTEANLAAAAAAAAVAAFQSRPTHNGSVAAVRRLSAPHGVDGKLVTTVLGNAAVASSDASESTPSAGGLFPPACLTTCCSPRAPGNAPEVALTS